MLTKEQIERLELAIAHPDLEQDMPLIMPPPVAHQMVHHVLDAIKGLKHWDKDTNDWVRSEEAAPPMSSRRFRDDV